MANRRKYQLMDGLRKEEFEALNGHIQKHGVYVPVVVDENGEVIDGHHRVKIAEQLGVDYPKDIRSGLTEEKKAELALMLNLCRRQSDPIRWGEMFKSLLKLRGIERKRGKPRDLNSPTMGDLAIELGVPPKTAEKRLAQADKYDALPTRDREKVHEGEATVKQMLAEQRKADQIAKEEAERAKLPPISDHPWLLTPDQQVVFCDALITDPPYGILDEPWEPVELEQFTRNWAGRWNGCGADHVGIFWSQDHLFDGRTWFDESLTNYDFRQLLIWVYRNNKSAQSRSGYKQTWEPILFYRRKDSGKEIAVGAGDWGGDLHDMDTYEAAVPQSNFKDAEMKVHPAQKPVSVMRWIVNSMARPGELVVDPFSGSGTTGIAAVQLGRRFHGIETNEDYLKDAERRIAAYGQI